MFKLNNISKTELLRRVLDGALTETGKEWAIENIDYLLKPMRLLGSSKKVEKGEAKKIITKVMYLFPHNAISLITLCAGAKGAGCWKGCLYQSGQLGMPVGRDAMAKRTVLYVLFPKLFKKALIKEIRKAHAKHGKALAIRLNGTSDIDWSDVIAANPETMHYDYTKLYNRVLKNKLPNYHLTYSGSAFNARSIKNTAKAINAGVNTAIAFNTKNLDGEFKTPSELDNFDTTDLRFLDNAGAVGALTRKGSSRADREAENEKDSFFFNPESFNKLTSLIASDKGIN